MKPMGMMGLLDPSDILQNLDEATCLDRTFVLTVKVGKVSSEVHLD